MSFGARTSSSSFTGSQQVESLLAKLRSNLVENGISLKEQQICLEELKVLGRTPANSNAIYAEDGLLTLSKYAFDQQDLAIAREASRCLANAMLLNESCRQTFLDLGYADKAVKRLEESDDLDDEFLLSRILFLLTYKTTVDMPRLVRELALAKSMCKNLRLHAQRLQDTKQTHPMDDMALAESLKLLFNTTVKWPELLSDFDPCVPHLFNILVHHPLPPKPLQPPLDAIINALMNLNISSTCASSPTNTDRLALILEKVITTYPTSSLDTIGLPLLTLLRHYHSAASPSGKLLLRSRLLPSDSARSLPLGKDNSLPSRLLRLSVSPSVFTLGKHISTLLFELSDSDPATLIHNIGYGYAAGFLATNNLEIPEGSMRDASVGDGDGDGEDVNPVTGQRRRDEVEGDELPEMTEEEKEREAERLYVLFERLRATGVVDVENPVHRARNEGRFEEVDD